jgi:acyl carrier protein
MRDRLENIFKESFGVDRLDDSMSIDNVQGWDSMAHVGLILTLQKEFGVAISPADAIELTDIKGILRFLTDHGIQ